MSENGKLDNKDSEDEQSDSESDYSDDDGILEEKMIINNDGDG